MPGFSPKHFLLLASDPLLDLTSLITTAVVLPANQPTTSLLIQVGTWEGKLMVVCGGHLIPCLPTCMAWAELGCVYACVHVCVCVCKQDVKQWNSQLF